MAAITKEQIKRVYALGSSIGILKSGNKDDNLHALVQALTGKESIRDLTDAEFKTVEHELIARMQMANRTAPLKRTKKMTSPAAPGMISKEQQGLAWRMIYRLMELDTASSASAGDRMCGAIKKILGIEATAKQPFAWVTHDDGQKLVEQLKRYVRSAERKVKKAAGAGG